MITIDYDEISKTYDHVRMGDLAHVKRLIQELPSRTGVCVLDIGCGTGNHTDLFQKLAQVQVYGIDPSKGMLENARRKNPNMTLISGCADQIPLAEDFFDLTYMTDVVHHVQDIQAMFAEIWRVTKPGGKGCILTQSHHQIEARPIVRYFPGTALVDTKRYPDIPELIEAAGTQGFIRVKSETFSEGRLDLKPDFLELVRKKGYSMLHLISEEEYQAGLKKLEQALSNGPIMSKSAGSTRVWFTKA